MSAKILFHKFPFYLFIFHFHGSSLYVGLVLAHCVILSHSRVILTHIKKLDEEEEVWKNMLCPRKKKLVG
jgi:hypothetical protein